MVQRVVAIADESTEPALASGSVATQMTVLVNGKLVCVTIAEGPEDRSHGGICNCGACQRGRYAEHAIDFL